MLDGGSGYCTLYSFINTFLHRYELWGKKSDLMLNMFDLTSSDLFSNNCSDKEELAFLSIYKIQSSHLDNSLIHSTQLFMYLFFCFPSIHSTNTSQQKHCTETKRINPIIINIHNPEIDLHQNKTRNGRIVETTRIE